MCSIHNISEETIKTIENYVRKLFEKETLNKDEMDFIAAILPAFLQATIHYSER